MKFNFRMEGSNRDWGDGLVASLTALGVTLFVADYFDNDASMRALAGLLVMPVSIGCFAKVGKYIFSTERSRRFKGLGRNYEGKYLGGGLDKLV